MQGRTVRVLLFVAILSLLAADVSVGCGAKAYVYGPVTQKFSTSIQEDHLILVNGQSYSVPYDFFQRVQVGDTVRFNGSVWSIVSKGNGPEQPAPGQPAPPP